MAERLFELFVARRDVYGFEDENGWKTVKGKLTVNEVEKHLKGEFTLGIYPFTEKGAIRWVLADLDYKGGDLVYEHVCKSFSKDSAVMVDTGGRGTHIFALLQPTPLWEIAQKIGKMEKTLGVRIFPKQREWRTSTIGNFVRLPLGVHHKTGSWSRIIRGDIWKVKPYLTCQHRVYDQFGDGNCLYYDSSIGYCQQDLCPKFLGRQLDG